MGYVLSASEIVEMGVQIERNGKDFYNAVAGLSKKDKAKKMFLYLAGEEDRHITDFEMLLSGIGKYEVPEESYSGEYYDYLKALSEANVFTKEKKGKEIAKKVKTDRDAIELAIGFEKDSILFYYEMKKVILEAGHKTIDKLVGQEQEHLRKLSELIRGL